MKWLVTLNLQRDIQKQSNGRNKRDFIDAEVMTDYLIRLLKMQRITRNQWKKHKRNIKKLQQDKALTEILLMGTIIITRAMLTQVVLTSLIKRLTIMILVI